MENFYLSYWPYQMLFVWVKVDLEAMPMKDYSALPKAVALLEPHHLIV